MKTKLLLSCLLATSLFGYLEWGGKGAFIFQIEAELLPAFIYAPYEVIHLFTVVPILGQLLLILTLIQKKPWKSLIYIAICCIGLLLGFIFAFGIVAVNFKVVFSNMPFMILSLWTILHLRQPEKDV